MAAHHTPLFAFLARPHPSVTIRAPDNAAIYLNHESRTQCSDRNIDPNASDLKFLRFVSAKPNNTGSVRIQILSLGSELAVRPCEKKSVGDQAIQNAHVCSKLCGYKLLLERHDLRIGRATEHVFQFSQSHSCIKETAT